MTFLKILFIMALCCCVSGVMPVGAEDVMPFTGEKITYAIKKMGVKAGKATLVFKGAVEMDGLEAYLIIFTIKGPKFYDEEKIYVDKESFLPLRVYRDIDVFGRKEKIIEIYEKEKGRIRLIKTAKGETTEDIIEKEGALDNIYSFIYRYRMEGEFNVGDTVDVHLPTKDIDIKLLKKNKLKAGGKVYDAYYMCSDPKKYKVWFEEGPHKIPLRIDGAIGFGKTSMVMVKYQE